MKLLFLGVTGFPLGEASAQKSIYICKSLVSAGADLTMVCKKSVLSKDVSFEAEGVYDGVPYICTTGTPYKSSKLIRRNLNKFKGFINEFRYIFKTQREGRIDGAIIYTRSFLNVVLYKFYSKIFNFKIVVNYGELRSKIDYKQIGLGLRLNDSFFDKYIFLLADGFLPISNYLIDIINEKAPNTPYLKIPPLCDYSVFEFKREESKENNYFLYCGSLAYSEIVEFLLKAYNKTQNSNFLFYLIVHGTSERKLALNKFIEETFSNPDQIKIFSNISFDRLAQLYANAYSLLIPLRPTIQDMARFPHKIGEYCATGRPIITTSVGEINNYFQDGESAYIASKYDIDLFAEKMKEAIMNSKRASQIGQNGKEIGLEHFNYKTYGKKIMQLFDSISK